MNQQRGFTLVEIAVVMVVIGLLLAGILKGGAIIRTVQVNDAITIVDDLRAATAIFKDRYHYLPGDWIYAAGEIPNVTTAGVGDGDGVISAAESADVFDVAGVAGQNHLFNAGLIKSSTVNTWFGGVTVAVLSTAVNLGGAGFSANVVNVIQFANLPCEVAMAMDTKMDDGNLATGNGRASVATCTAGGANDPVPFYGVPLQ